MGDIVMMNPAGVRFTAHQALVACQQRGGKGVIAANLLDKGVWDYSAGGDITANDLLMLSEILRERAMQAYKGNP